MKPIYYYLSIALCCVIGCVSEISFEEGDTQFLIIDGVITNSLAERQIFIRRRIGQKIDTTQVSATGKLFKNGVLIADLIPYKNLLRVPNHVSIEEGASYYLEIETNDGNRYTTLPQKVMPKLRTDSMSIDLSRETIRPSTSGIIQQRWFVNVYAYVTIPQTKESPLYFRWQVDESWSIVEIPNEEDIMDVVNICYFSSSISAHQPAILNGNALGSGVAKQQIAARQIGDAFSHKHYFNAYTHAIGEDAYLYYEKAERLIGTQGEIFQEIPASIVGNVRNMDNEETVLGFVEFSVVDTLRLSVVRADLGRSITDQCAFTPAAEECFECILRIGASYDRPFYWD